MNSNVCRSRSSQWRFDSKSLQSVKDLTFEVGQTIRYGNRAALGNLTTEGGDPVVEDRAVGDLAV